MLLNEILKLEILETIDALLEGVTDLPEDADLNTQLEILMQRLETIKKALGITNRLPPGDSRKYHRSRIMGFMNKVRALFNRVANQLEAEMQNDATQIAPQPNQSVAEPFRQAA